jgi:hypothetical protein
MLDPYNAACDDTGVWRLPAVQVGLQRKAVALVQRIAGADAAGQMRTLMLDGYPPNFVAVAANAKATEAAAAQPDPNAKSKKRKFVAMQPMNRRISISEQYGCEDYLDLVKAVIRLLSFHATICAVERNWSFVGAHLLRRSQCSGHGSCQEDGRHLYQLTSPEGV